MYRASPFGLIVVRFPLDFFVGITPEYRPGMRLQMWFYFRCRISHPKVSRERAHQWSRGSQRAFQDFGAVALSVCADLKSARKIGWSANAGIANREIS